MNIFTRHTIVNLLLFCYMLLGAVAHFEKLTVYGFGGNPQHLVQEKNSIPHATKVYWTQHKHIPTTIKISVPSPAIFVPTEINQLQAYGVLYNYKITHHYTDTVVSLHSSRAPPLV